MDHTAAAIKIRPWELRDIPSLARYANNTKIWENVRDRFPHPYTEEDARNWVKHNLSITPVTNFAIEYAGEAIGAAGIELQQDIYRKNAEVGYWIGEPFWGKGVAAEALRYLVIYAFEKFDLNRLYARVKSDNKASMKVLEKAGFTKEAVHKRAIFKDGKIYDEVIFALLKK